MLIVIDSFDHYGTAELLYKWDSLINSPTISSSTYRTGTRSLFLSSNTGVVKSLAAKSSFFCGIALYHTNIGGATDKIISFLYDGTAQVRLYTHVDGSLSVRRNTTQLAVSSPGLITNNVWYYVEFKMSINDTTGSFDVRINGVSVLSGSGYDTQNITGNSTANQIELYGRNNLYIDDFYLCDTTGSINQDFLGDVKVACIMPDSAGAYSEWTPYPSGANYSLVDEIPPNSDTDYVITSGIGNRDTYGFGSFPTTSGSIYGLQISPFSRKDDAGTRITTNLFRIGTTVYSGGSDSIANSYKFYPYMQEMSPATSGYWTIAEINAAEFGIELVA